jgi:DNA-binding transcriptional regulator YhcF (GntR family)
VPTPFSTDAADELPVGLQLSWRLRALIATGELAAGEKLPSFRRLAEWAGVNLNTVRAVYEGLEKRGLVVARQGQGTFVADDVEGSPLLERVAVDALRRANEAGLDLRDLAIVTMACASIPDELRDEARQVDAPVDIAGIAEANEVIAVRHELRRQIGRLEAELASYVRDLPGDLPTARRAAEAHVADVEELEQTRDTLIAQLSEAQRTAEERARLEGQAIDRRKELLKQPPSTKEAGAGPLRRAMGRWRDKS